MRSFCVLFGRRRRLWGLRRAECPTPTARGGVRLIQNERALLAEFLLASAAARPFWIFWRGMNMVLMARHMCDMTNVYVWRYSLAYVYCTNAFEYGCVLTGGPRVSAVSSIDSSSVYWIDSELSFEILHQWLLIWLHIWMRAPCLRAVPKILQGIWCWHMARPQRYGRRVVKVLL